MKRLYLQLLTMFTAAVLVAQTQTGEAALGAALHKEEVQGDLNGAISAYQKLLAGKGTSHKVSAEALYHLGLCYQKLGDSKSREAFQRLVRDYADTPWASRVSIGDLRLSSGRETTTLVWASRKADDEGNVSPDGRYISYPDWDTGNLALHDLVNGTDKAITTAGSWKNQDVAFAEESVFSRDGKQIAYGWYQGREKRFSLWVANVTGTADSRKIYASAEMRFIAPTDWSPDGRFIAVSMEPEGSDARTGQAPRPGMKAAIALVGVRDGSVQIIGTRDWTGPSNNSYRALFSPDGKYLAYDRTIDGGSKKRGVYVVELLTHKEVPVALSAAGDQLAAWSPDGKQILVTSRRTGTIGLWSVRFENGAVHGEPEMVKANLGSSGMVGMTGRGALYYFVPPTSDLPRIQLAGFDMRRGTVTSAPNDISGGDLSEGSNSPAWSPDGKTLAYVSGIPLGSGTRWSIRLRSIETGEIREIGSDLENPTFLRWTFDGDGLLWTGANGLHQINVRSGADSLLATRPTGSKASVLSPDGKTVYQNLRDGTETVFAAVDLGSGRKQEIIRRTHIGGLHLSPDGRYLATASIDPESHSRTFLILPVNGGRPVNAIALPGEPLEDAVKKFEGGFLALLCWEPDSKSVLLRKRSAESPNVELWQGFADGSPARRVTEKLDSRLIKGSAWISPDGQRIAFVSPASGSQKSPPQIMSLENFLRIPK